MHRSPLHILAAKSRTARVPAFILMGLLAIPLISAAPASAHFGDVTVTAETRVAAEAFGDGVPAGFEEFWSESVDGSVTGQATSSYNWPPPPWDGQLLLSCPETGCASKAAHAQAFVDRAAGLLGAGAMGSIGTGGTAADNAGYNHTNGRAEIEDTITLSAPATVVLEGRIQGTLGATHTHHEFYGDPRARLQASIRFTGLDEEPSEWPYITLGGISEEYEAPMLSCAYPGNCFGPVTPHAIDEVFSVEVDLPEGTSFFTGSLYASVDIQVWGAQGDAHHEAHSASALADFASTAEFRIIVPEGVTATSGSGDLPIIGGAGGADTEPPIVTVPDDITAEATGPDGAAVTFEVSATDNVDGDVPATCDWESGDTFPLGTATVECTASDAAGNIGSASFTVTVVDTTPPVITVPADMTVEATSAAGAVVSYEVTASDIVEPEPDVTCDPASGSTFPIGETVVECTATDGSGNSATASFTVTVVEPSEAPNIDDVIAAVDAAVAEGTLVGDGPGRSAAGRLGAWRNMLNAAGNALEVGDTTGACDVLLQAYLRVDGNPTPPDFVTGAARQELAQLVLELMDSLGCSPQ